MKPKVLAAASHPGGMNALYPVVSRLMHDSTVDLVLLAHGATKSIIESQNINFERLSYYPILDVSPLPIEKIIDNEKPQLIVMGQARQDEQNRDILEHSLVLAARKDRVPTLSVSDFWTNRVSCYSDTFNNKKFEYLTDKITVIDEIQLDILKKEGFSSDRLVITGNPYFDNFNKRFINLSEIEELRKKIGSEKTLIYYAGSAWLSQKYKLGYSDGDNLEILFNSVGDKDARLVLTYHPRLPDVDKKQIENIIKKFRNAKVLSGIKSQNIVLATDITITPYSTVGIEAIYMGKPVISLQPNLKTENYFSFLEGMIPFAFTYEAGVDLANKACDCDYRGVITEKLKGFKTDGNAAERVTRLIYDLLR